MQAGQLTTVLTADASGLEQGLNKAQQSLNNFGKSAAGTQNVMTSLSRVVQDLPFGFIAIQNNLDPLVQSFQSLRANSKNNLEALKSLAGALIGPAGLALGFAAVGSAITSAIQKYGSLNKALVELSAASDDASVRQRELAKATSEALASTEGEVQTVQNLVRALIDSNNAQNVRTAAYETLRKIQPGLIQDLSLENALTAEGSDLIAQRSLQLIEYIKLKGKESALIKLVEQETKKQLETARSGVELVKNQNTALNRFINLVAGGGNATAGLIARQRGLTNELEASDEAAQSYAQALEEVQRQILGIDTKITGVSKVTTPKSAGTRGKAAIPIPAEIVPDRATVGGGDEAADRAILRNFGIENGIQIPATITVPQGLLQKETEAAQRFKEAFQVQQITDSFNNLLAPAIDTVFGALANGANVFQALQQSLRAFVAQLIISIAKAAALAGLISIFAPGAAAARGGFFGLFESGIKGFLGIGGTAAPTFSGGGLPTGGLSGQVVFVQRGTDLVGVLQRSNNRLNRVG